MGTGFRALRAFPFTAEYTATVTVELLNQISEPNKMQATILTSAKAARPAARIVDDPGDHVQGSLWLVGGNHVACTQNDEHRQVVVPPHKAGRPPAFGTERIHRLRLGRLNARQPLPLELGHPGIQSQNRADEIKLSVVDGNRQACSRDGSEAPCKQPLGERLERQHFSVYRSKTRSSRCVLPDCEGPENDSGATLLPTQ